MTAESKGRDLFIVDNSVSGWTGLRYLEEWSGIAKAFDIATGYDLHRDAVREEPGEIVASIRSKPETQRKCDTEQKTLVELRARIEKHIKNTYLKRVDAPVGVKPALRCWMELN